MEDIKSGIYKITCLANQKIYIGSTANLQRRSSQHFRELKNNNHCNKYMQRAFSKYGENNFTFEIVELVKDSANLVNREQYYMDTLEVYNKKIGYNMCPAAGSLLGTKRTKEQVEKIRRANIGKKRTPEQNKRTSELAKGRKHTEEAKNKIGEASKGNTYGRFNKGRKRPEETLINMRTANLGEKNPMWGIKQSKETLEKRMRAISKKVINITTGEIFENIIKASRFYDIDSSSITKTCKGKRKIAGGYHWAYY